MSINDGVVRHNCLPVQFTASVVTQANMHLEACNQKIYLM